MSGQKSCFMLILGHSEKMIARKNKAARGDSEQLVPREQRRDAAATQPPLSPCGQPSVSCQPLKGPRPRASLRAVPRARSASQPAENKAFGLQAGAGPVLRMQVAGTPCAVGPLGGRCPRVGAQRPRAASSLAGGQGPRVFLASGGRACEVPGRPAEAKSGPCSVRLRRCFRVLLVTWS